MEQTFIDVQTGEVTVVKLTPEEVAAAMAASAEEEARKAAYVPPSVPMWAVRTVLQNNNLFDQAQSLIEASTDNALKNVWEYGNDAVRSSAAIASLSAALELTEEQVDQMFRDAGSLSV